MTNFLSYGFVSSLGAGSTAIMSGIDRDTGSGSFIKGC
jgi:hypothetical protein